MQHILEQIKDRYSVFKDTIFIKDKESFRKFIDERYPNFAHKGPREYPCLVEAVSLKGDSRPIVGYTYVEQVQQYIFDRKLS